jgi:tetratricopeptide (TPR) repeat protein
MANKKYDEAIKTGEKLLSYGDSSTFVLNNLGKSYFFILDYKNALKNFLVIESKSMDSEALYYSIGLSYRGLKDYKNAIPYLEKAIQEGISTKIASYYGLLGDSFEGVNKNTEANAAYKKGLQFENNGSLLYNIALVYETKLNDKKNAIDYYEQYLKTINPKEQTKLIGFIKNKIAELKR